VVQVNVLVKDVKTIHTHHGGRLDQPLVEVTLEVNKAGETEKHELKFTEMLYNLAGMTEQELMDKVESLVTAYVMSAYRGQGEVDSATGEWKEKAKIIGRTFVVDV